MPFPLRVINHREDVPDVYDNNPDYILQKTAVSNMVGLLQQLNQISVFASEIFTDILNTTKNNSSRIKNCKHRLNTLQSKLPSIEKSFLVNSPNYFYDNPYSGKEYLRNDPLNGLLFTREDANSVVNRRRQVGEPPSDLSKLDRICQKGDKCIKSFTDTDFFINEWLKNEKIKREEERKRRKANKKNKKKKHKRKHQKQIARINKPTYDQHGNKVQSDQPQQIDVTQYKLLDDDRDFTFLKSSKNDKKKDLQPPQSHHQANVSYANVLDDKQIKNNVKHVPVMSMNGPPPNPMQLQLSLSDNNMPSIPPPNPLQSSTSIKVQKKLRGLASVVPINTSVPDNAQSPSAIYATQYQKRNINNPMNLTNASQMIQQSPPPVPKQLQSQPQVPAQRLAFLGDIKNFNGNKLKHTVVKRQPIKDSRSLLLGQLRIGVELKNSNLRKIAPKVEKKNLIFEAMKDRRRHIGDSSSEEESDWGSDSN